MTVRKKCRINFILILCILFSGIGFEVNGADTLILHAAQEEAHVMKTAEVLSANQDACTNELIGVRTCYTVSVQETRVNTKINGKAAVIQMAQLPLTKLSVFMSEMLSTQVRVENACNATVIVGYIHQKDGKKS